MNRTIDNDVVQDGYALSHPSLYRWLAQQEDLSWRDLPEDRDFTKLRIHPSKRRRLRDFGRKIGAALRTSKNNRAGGYDLQPV
jgi:hypothetical protein